MTRILIRLNVRPYDRLVRDEAAVFCRMKTNPDD